MLKGQDHAAAKAKEGANRNAYASDDGSTLVIGPVDVEPAVVREWV